MEGNAQNGTAAAPQNPANSGTGPANPSGGANASDNFSIPRSEYDRLVRHGEQVKGFQPFYEKAKAFGISRAEDFDKYDPYFKTIQELEKRGVKPDMLSRMYSQDAEDDLGGGKQSQQIDPTKLREELMGEVRKEMAGKEWEQLTAREKDYVEQALKEFYGDETVDDWSKYQMKMAFERHLDANREFYPKDHPLYNDRLKPYGESEAKKAVEHFKAEKARFAGEAMKAKADAVNKAKPKVSTPAGSSPSQGPAKNEGTKKTAGQDLDDAVLEALGGR